MVKFPGRNKLTISKETLTQLVKAHILDGDADIRITSSSHSYDGMVVEFTTDPAPVEVDIGKVSECYGESPNAK